MAEKTMEDIEGLTERFALARDDLRHELETLEAAVKRLKESRLKPLRELVSGATNAHDELNAAIDDSKALFVKPKSRVLHGIKVGYQKSKGSLSFVSDALVVALIRKHFGDRQALLIKVTESPVKAALEKLPAADLKKIGVTVVPGIDRVLIKPADSEIDKLVDALLADDEPAKIGEVA